MRSLATISSGGDSATSRSARSYISRTFPLAIRGRSASVVTCFDATNGSGDRTTGSVDLVDPREHAVQAPDDLVRVAHVVVVGEDLVEVERQRTHALVAGQQVAQRGALVPRLLRQLLHDAVGVVAGHAAPHEREQDALGEQRA